MPLKTETSPVSEAEIETAQSPPPPPVGAGMDHRHPRPKLGFAGSILYGVSKIIDSIWSGAAKVIAGFKDLNQGQAVVAVMAVVLVLGSLGATAAVGAMAYVCRIVVNQPAGADANAALIRYMNERDERTTAERDRDYERSRRHEIQQELQTNENNRKLTEKMEQLSRSVDISTKTNEKVVAILERMNNKLPDPAAPMPRTKVDVGGQNDVTGRPGG